MNDLEYYENLWIDNSSNSSLIHTKAAWDEKAHFWTSENKSEFSKVNSENRLNDITNFLSQKGILNNQSSIIDIGCGPGCYVNEFAKKSKFVVGTDISEKMIDYAKNTSDKLGYTNTMFLETSFKDLDVQSLNFQSKFDLAFASITPAISDVSSINKMISLSKKYCFINTFVYKKDSLRELIFKDVLNQDDKKQDRASPAYCIFNILWQMGYYPEIKYYKETANNILDVSADLAKHYAMTIAKEISYNMLADDIYRCFEKNSSDGKIEENSDTLFAWIFWEI